MKKTLLILLLLMQVAFSATPEQVKQFIMVSKSDRDLIEIEQMIDEMLPPESTKNSETIETRFEEYLEKNFSEDEMTELIKIYKNPLLQELYSMDSDLPEEELNEFNLSLAENPISSERLELNENLLKNMFDDEDVQMMITGFQDKIMGELGLEKENNISKEERKEIVTSTRKELKLPLLYTTQTMSIDELKELLELVNMPKFKNANKTVLKASMYALDNFLVDIVNGMMNSFKDNLKDTPDEWTSTFIPESKE